MEDFGVKDTVAVVEGGVDGVFGMAMGSVLEVVV